MQETPPQSSVSPDSTEVRLVYPPGGGLYADQLMECSSAFSRGNFARARQLAIQTKKGNATPAETAFAEEIIKRTSRDPLAFWIALASALFLAIVIYFAVGR